MERDAARRSFNPHWIGDECCRDYQIGNVIIKDVPDNYVMARTKFRGGYGFAQGNADEFMAGPIRISFANAREAQAQRERAERAERALMGVAGEIRYAILEIGSGNIEPAQQALECAMKIIKAWEAKAE